MTLLTDDIKTTIDGMSYEEMLRAWRFAPVGSLYLSGEVGEYFAKIMMERRHLVGRAQHTTISKLIGWGEG